MKRSNLLCTIGLLGMVLCSCVAGFLVASDQAPAKAKTEQADKAASPAAPDISDCESAKIRVAHLEALVANLELQLKQAEVSQRVGHVNQVIDDVKATHKFGADVLFDPSTDRFFRPAPPPAPPKAEEKPAKK